MKYNLVDLFCGAGGLSLGFEQTGRFRSVGALDNWSPAVETFIHNRPDFDLDAMIQKDSSHIFTNDFDSFSKKIWERYGLVDVVVGGPPCQGLSLAGKRIADDSRNQLFKAFVTAVDKLRPSVFIMENVPGLLSMMSGKLNLAIINSFQEIGYTSFIDYTPTILKSEEYGVPQLRRRLIYVGFREIPQEKPFQWPPQITHIPTTRSSNTDSGQLGFERIIETNLRPVPTVKEAISDLPLISSGGGAEEMEYTDNGKLLTPYQQEMRDWSSGQTPKVYNHEASNHTDKMISMIQAAEPGKSVDPKYTDSRKWNPDKPSFTVKALGSGGGSTNRRAFHYDDRTPRGSTVRENARIQSFPDWYRFMGPKTHQMTQVGNAVPPMLARAIAMEIADALDSFRGR